MTLAYLGYIDQARSRMDEAIVGGPPARTRLIRLAQCSCSANWTAGFISSPIDARMHAEWLALSTEHGFPFIWVGHWHSADGRWSRTGKRQEGLALLTQGLAELRATGGRTQIRPIWLVWLAEAYAMLGQTAEALNCLAEAARIDRDHRGSATTKPSCCIGCTGDLLNAAGDRSGPSGTIVRPSPLPSGRARSSFNCGRRPASPGSGATKASARKPVICSVRSTIGSPKVSMRRT